ncbi:MAG: hypothetical protein DRP60_10600 [Spirochaetes bacterium]|nr:MAG: hypothetical protein DRP60_10600 [Spirochaetota bacterium]
MRRSVIEMTPPAAIGGVISLVICSRFNISGFVKLSSLVLSGSAALFFAVASALFLIHGNKRVRILALFLSSTVGFFGLLTALGAAEFRSAMYYTGIPVSSVRSINVLLGSDPKALSRGGWVADAALLSAESESIVCDARGKVVIFGRGDFDKLGDGRYVHFNGKLKRSETADKGVRSDTYSYIFFSDNDEPGEWKRAFYKLRHRITGELERRLFSGSYDSGTFLSALLLGRKTDPGSPLIRFFRKSGCIHILALSGFHVGLIAFALRGILKPLVGYTGASILSAAGALLFLVFVGIRPSLFRAVLMYVLYTRDSLRGYKVSLLHYLSTAFIIQALVFPFSVYSLSFRLSYAALAGLSLGGTAFTRILSRYFPLKLSTVLGAGLGAQLTTLPLTTAAFGIWYPIGIAASPLLTTLSAGVMALGSTRLLFTAESQVGLYLSQILDGAVTLISRTADFFGSVPAVELSSGFSWLIAAGGTIIPLIIIRSIQHEHLSNNQSRFPGLNSGISGQPGAGSPKEVGAELSHQSRGPQKNYFIAGNRRGHGRLGNRPGIRRHEHRYNKSRRFSYRLRNRPGLLPVAQGIPGFTENESGGRRCYENLEERMGIPTSRQGSGESSL